MKPILCLFVVVCENAEIVFGLVAVLVVAGLLIHEVLK